MRRSKGGFLLFLVVAVIFIFVLSGNGTLEKLSGFFQAATPTPEVLNDGVFILAKDQAAPTPTRQAVEVTTLPDETPVPTDSSEDGTEDTEEDSGVFSRYIAERDEVRERELSELAELENADDPQIASEALSQRLELVRCMEAEITLRGLLLAKGYKDAVATVRPGSVNIAIIHDSLTNADIAAILDMAARETGEASGNIKIIPASEE